MHRGGTRLTAFAELPTPALLLDEPRLTRNIARIGDRVKSLGARLRPHIKTHKCVEVGRRQIAGQFGGITVSTLAEASVFAAAGFDDITYAVPIEPGKFAAVVALAASGVRMAVITDDAGIPAPLAAAAARAHVTLDVYVKVDCGYHRCGVDPDGPTLLEIVQRIGERSALRFAGLLTHAGHSYHVRGAEALRAVAVQEREVIRAAAARLAALGITVPIVSVGSTPSMSHVDHLDGVHEVRVGNYAFFDATQATLGSCTFDDCVLTVLASVVHRDHARGRVVLDAGAIALSKDRGAVDMDPTAGYGRVLDIEGRDLGLRVSSVSQEHGVVPVADATQLDHLPVGARVRVLVNHSCLTAAQFEAFLVHHGTEVVDRWAIHRGW